MDQVVACVDGSRVTQSVCEAALWAAQGLKVPLVFLHSLEPRPGAGAEDHSGAIGLGAREELLAALVALDAEHAQIALQKGQLVLQTLAEYVRGRGFEQVVTVQRHGELTDTIGDVAGAGALLVVGRQGVDHEFTEGALGSQLEALIRTCERPVLVVPSSFTEPRSVMLAFDGGAASTKALQVMTQSPSLLRLPCHLVMVGERSGAFDAAHVRLQAEGFAVQTTVLSGASPAEALVEYQSQQSIGLTVMGAYTHSRIRQWFRGSQTRRLLSHSMGSVLVVR